MAKTVEENTKKKKLTERQGRVIHEFMTNGFNKAAAMRACEYSDKYAKTKAHRLFSLPQVDEEIQRRLKLQRDTFEVHEGDILRQMHVLASANLGMIILKLIESDYDLKVLTVDEMYCLAKFDIEDVWVGRGEEKKLVRKVKIATRDVKAALDTLFKYKGMLTDKVELTGAETLTDRVAAARRKIASDAPIRLESK